MKCHLWQEIILIHATFKLLESLLISVFLQFSINWQQKENKSNASKKLFSYFTYTRAYICVHTRTFICIWVNLSSKRFTDGGNYWIEENHLSVWYLFVWNGGGQTVEDVIHHWSRLHSHAIELFRQRSKSTELLIPRTNIIIRHLGFFVSRYYNVNMLTSDFMIIFFLNTRNIKIRMEIKLLFIN